MSSLSYINNDNTSSPIKTESVVDFIKSDKCYTLTVKTKDTNFIVDIDKSLINPKEIIKIIKGRGQEHRVCINLENCCIFYEPDQELLTYEMWAGHNVSGEVECYVPRQQMIDAIKK